MSHRGLGEMGSADRLSLRRAATQRAVIELETQLPDRVRHRLGPTFALGSELLQPFMQQVVMLVDQVSEDVQVPMVSIEGGDLHPGDDPQLPPRPGLAGLGNAGDAVVIGQ